MKFNIQSFDCYLFYLRSFLKLIFLRFNHPLFFIAIFFFTLINFLN
jgi:hypothetical protein